MADTSKPLSVRLDKANAAIKGIAPLLESYPKFANDCEAVFSKLRLACMHLRRDKEALDAVENKEIVWRFICRLCKQRPFLKDRCEEVLDILLMSELWKKELLNDPESKLEDLPESVQSRFPGEVASGDVKGVIVVQSCSEAKLMPAAPESTETVIGRGLFVAASFAQGTTDESVAAVARSLLTAKLSASPHDQRPESIVALCRRGVAQGILLVPQTSLCAQLRDGDVSHTGACDDSEFERLYAKLAKALRGAAQDLVEATPKASETCLPEIAVAAFGAQHRWELRSDGFMHSFEV
mmetsp:Transcript_86505/g.242217  ORF Transcript_86505/g.242217 Transcript_86505/m.242217 type:complete len:296 (-) Transcript_86505:76-963(-)